MNCCQFSYVTRNYVNTFQCILDEMIRKMTSAQLSDSISGNFILQMIPHHKAAIEMSRNILQYTTCIPLEKIAAQIIAEQTKSIENMQAITDICRQRQNCLQDVRSYENRVSQIMETMFTDMANACTDKRCQADAMFAAQHEIMLTNRLMRKDRLISQAVRYTKILSNGTQFRFVCA